MVLGIQSTACCTKFMHVTLGYKLMHVTLGYRRRFKQALHHIRLYLGNKNGNKKRLRKVSAEANLISP